MSETQIDQVKTHKDVCLCCFRDDDNVYSIGFWDEKKQEYYSPEGRSCLNTEHKLDLFYYLELDWDETKSILSAIIASIGKLYNITKMLKNED